MPPSAVRLPAWTADIAESWELMPRSFPNTSPVLSSKTTFDIATQLRRHWSLPNSPISAHFAVGAVQIPIDAEIFPAGADKTFYGYMRRVTSLSGKGGFLFYVKGFDEKIAPSLLNFYPVVNYLYSRGVRWTHLEFELYIGCYDWTAIGIHRENCGNIHYIVEGSKTLFIWPEKSLLADLESPDLAADGMTRMMALNAGLLERHDCAQYSVTGTGVIYFPSRCWHVGSSPNLSVAIDLAFYGVSSTSRLVQTSLQLDTRG